MMYSHWLWVVQVAALMIGALIVYHHVGYPLLLKLLSRLRSRRQRSQDMALRNFRHCVGDQRLPSVHLFVPAYNESAVIQQKIDSFSWLDYPADKLTITLLCDGCDDDTVDQARQALARFSNQDLTIRIADFDDNRGKVAMVNEAICQCEADILAFSDASAILASDALWRMAQHFMCNPMIGVVSGDYSLLQAGSDGESAYWKYQNRIRQLESDLGAIMGAPGAFYAVRSHLCQPLELDTINDDFILPMRAVAQGYQALYDPELKILETEGSDAELDAKRRIRISQGNMQQILRLKRLMLPDFGWVSWMFLSGKFLRVLMPYCLLGLLLLSAWLAPSHWFWGVLYLAQMAVYLLACVYHLDTDHWLVRSKLVNNKLVRLVTYLCVGHLMGLIGSARYLLNSFKQSIRRLLGLKITEQQSWKKIR